MSVELVLAGGVTAVLLTLGIGRWLRYLRVMNEGDGDRE